MRVLIRIQDDEVLDYMLNQVILSTQVLILVRKLVNLKWLEKNLGFSERFRIKVITIKVNKDIDSMNVDKLVGSLETYKMFLPSS